MQNYIRKIATQPVLRIVVVKDCVSSEFQYPKMFFSNAISIALWTLGNEAGLRVASSIVFEACFRQYEVRQFCIKKRNQEVLTNGELLEAVRTVYIMLWCVRGCQQWVEKCAGLFTPCNPLGTRRLRCADPTTQGLRDYQELAYENHRITNDII